MKSLLLAALLMSPAYADEPAAEKPHPKCEDGSDPIFTIQPFRALYCPPGGKESAAKPLDPEKGPLPAKGAWSAALKGLDGNWRGIVYYGGRRYEARLKVSGGGKRWRLKAMDYATHFSVPLEAELLKPGWFSSGAPKLELTTPSLPTAKRGAKLWLGAHPAKDSGQQWLAVWQGSGRPEYHRAEYSVAADRLTGTYVMEHPEVGKVGCSFELARVGDEQAD